MSAPQLSSSAPLPGDTFFVRLDSQFPAYTQGLREFLEAWRATILPDQNSGRIPLYHIIAGDEIYVKAITGHPSSTQTKRLVLLQTKKRDCPPEVFRAKNAKIVLLPAGSIAARETETIFAFFFTSPEHVLDVRLQHEIVSSEEPEPLVEPTVPTNTETEKDRARIDATIRDIFHGSEEPKQSKPKKKKTFGKKKLSLFIFLLLPFLWYGLMMTASISSLALAGVLLSDGKIATAARANMVSGWAINRGKETLKILGWPLVTLGRQTFVRKQEHVWSLLSNMHEGLSGATQAITHGKNTSRGLLLSENNQTAGSLAASIDATRNDLFLIQNHLGLAQAELASMLGEQSFPFSLPFVTNVGTALEQKLTTLRQDTTTMDNLLSLYQKIAGFSGKRTYLILLQNGMELRPTGGFIGSIGLATFAEGKLTDLSIQDVYTVDGQLKGHVDPPKPIAEFLGQEHWYLRDSNWDPDFSVSGAKAAWFYEKETGTKVDGVIALSVPMVGDILSATGPVLLADYNDRITAENFFGKSLYYTQSGFFPGSTQKKDFLGTLTNALILKLTTEKGIDPFKVFRVITKNLNNFNILFSFPDQDLETLVRQLQWAGAVPTYQSCVDETACLFDYSYIVDANLSVNKVNYFVKRDSMRSVSIAENGDIEETITVSYKNTSVGDDGGGGHYRNYSQIYVPKDATINSITLDGQVVHQRSEAKDKLTGKQTEVKPPFTEPIGSTQHLALVGFVFDVPAGTERRAVISYKRGKKLTFYKQGATIAIVEQRQPGSINTTGQTTVVYPIFWEIQLPKDKTSRHVKQSFLAKDAQVTYNTGLSGNTELRLTFTK